MCRGEVGSESTKVLDLLSYKSRKHEKELYHTAQNGYFLKQSESKVSSSLKAQLFRHKRKEVWQKTEALST